MTLNFIYSNPLLARNYENNWTSERMPFTTNKTKQMNS